MSDKRWMLDARLDDHPGYIRAATVRHFHDLGRSRSVGKRTLFSLAEFDLTDRVALHDALTFAADTIAESCTEDGARMILVPDQPDFVEDFVREVTALLEKNA